MAGVTTGTNTATFVDGPDGARWLRRAATETVAYLAGQELHLAAGASAPTAVRYYSQQGHTVAVRRSGAQAGLSWALDDRQGTVSVTVNADTGEAARTRYLPYGGSRTSAAGPTDRGWLGQIRDTDTGLDYLNARYYDPELAHFLCTDPLDDQSTPQHANPYGYGADDPIAYSDPSGLATYYTVARGENWYTVKAKSGLTLNQLRALNGGSLKALAIGQRVNITRPASADTSAAMAAAGAAAVAASQMMAQEQIARQIAAATHGPSGILGLAYRAVAQKTGYTVGRCSGVEASAVSSAGTYSACWVATPSGEIGYTVTLGGGMGTAGFGVGANANAGYTASNAKTLSDLGGYFGSMSVGGSRGIIGGSGSIAAGYNGQHKLIWQVTVSASAGWSLNIPGLPKGTNLSRLDKLVQNLPANGTGTYTWIFQTG
jgi:RHS repeat-associated protein